MGTAERAEKTKKQEKEVSDKHFHAFVPGFPYKIKRSLRLKNVFPEHSLIQETLCYSEKMQVTDEATRLGLLNIPCFKRFEWTRKVFKQVDLQ